MSTVQDAIQSVVTEYRKGNLETARLLADELNNLHPSSVQILNLSGIIKRDLKIYAEALEHFKQAIRLAPNNADSYVNMGTLLMDVGQLDDAMRCFSCSLKINQNDPDVYYNLGNLFKMSQKSMEAINAYWQAIKLNSKYKEAYNNLGQIFISIGKIDDAVDAFTKALEIDPDYFHANLNLGNAFKLQKRFEGAIASYKVAAQIVPNNPGVYNNLGSAHALCGDLQKAIKNFVHAIELRPDFWGCLDNLFDLVVQLPESMRHNNAELSKLHTQGFFNKISTPRGVILHAVNNYICGNFEAVDKWLTSYSSFKNEQLSTLDPKIMKFCIAFNNFLTALLKEKPAEKVLDDNSLIYHVGESHCLSYAHRPISISGTTRNIKPMIIFGAKAFHFSEPKPSKYKELFKLHICSIPDNSIVFLSFGEIDCRIDEGIISFGKKTGKDLSKIVRNTVSGFVKFAHQQNFKKSHKYHFFNLPAPVYDDRATTEMNKCRLEVTKLFNANLKSFVEECGYRLIDLYSHTVLETGYSNLKHHIDSNHLGGSVIPLIQSELDD